MSELPENIWTWAFMSAKQNEFMTGGWHDEPEPHPTGKETKYIRYDKHTGYLADIKAAFGEACEMIAEYKEQHDVDKATIAELEVNINLKANWIHRTMSGMGSDAQRIAELESALRSILQIPNSDAAQGIMKAFAEDALGRKRHD